MQEEDWRYLEASDVMRSEREARQRQAQRPPQRLSHRLECGLAITSPVLRPRFSRFDPRRTSALSYHGEPLAAGVARPGEHDSLSYTEALLQDVEDEFVVYHGIRVVDAHWVRAIMERDVCVGNALAEVGLCK